jgi:hypothetical protein
MPTLRPVRERIDLATADADILEFAVVERTKLGSGRVLSAAPTVLTWRKGARSPKISALLEVLTEDRSGKRQAQHRKKS